MTVLFGDLVGFTALSESLDVETVRELQTAYFDGARTVIERYGGTVEKFIGDAVMAVWGAPITREDDAERAVRAGLDLVDAVAVLGTTSGRPGLSARVGVLSGEVAVSLGATGQGLVSGDIVNTAARLQSAAAPGTVLVGEATKRASEAAIAYDDAGDRELKGKGVPVAAWRAVRIVAGRGGSGRIDRVEAPFVGRTPELRALKDALQAVGEERRARFVGLVGQAGIGKSRLAWEFEKHVDGLIENVYWHRGRSPAYGDGVAYWALGEMVRERARIAESDSPGDSSAKLDAMLADYLPDTEDRRWVEPHLRVLLGLDPTAGTDRTEQFAAWRRLFEAIARRGTTVLVFEDLQWADDGLIDFIDSLFEWSRAHPILVVALTRPELLDRRPTFGSSSRNALRLHLDPLTPSESRTLLDSLAPDLPESVASAVVGRADGIPLYLIELIRMFRDETGAILASAEAATAIPPSLQALVAARLDALEPADRSLLQDASVLGTTFTLEAITAVSTRAPGEIEPALRALVRREYLVIDADPRSPERGQYGFVQSVVREVAYGSLARRDRRVRHIAAARFFETLDDDEVAPVLANHYLEAYRASPDDDQGVAIRAQARLAIRAAADRAARLHNDRQAIADLEVALELADDDAERAGILERQAALADSAADFELSIERGSRALDLYRRLDDAAGATRAVASLGAVELKTGRFTEGTALLLDAIERLDPVADGESYARVAALVARSHMLAGRGSETVEWADRALAAAAPTRLVETIAEAMNTRGVGLHHQGRLDEAIATIGAAIELAGVHRFSQAELRARFNLAGRLFGDDPTGAAAILEGARDLAARTGRRDWQLLTSGFFAGMLLVLGRWDDCLAAFDPTPVDELPLDERIEQLFRIALIETSRGDRDALDRTRQLVEEIGAGSISGPQQLASRAMSEADIAILLGRLDEAERLVASGITANFAPRAASIQASIALRRRDPAGIRTAISRTEISADRSALIMADRRFLEAAAAALEGRRDVAVDGFRTATRTIRDLGAFGILSEVLLDIIDVLGPDDPETPAYAAEARALLDPLGGRMQLERLAAIEARAGDQPGARGKPTGATAEASTQRG